MREIEPEELRPVSLPEDTGLDIQQREGPAFDSRITAIYNIYHQCCDEEPYHIRSGFTRYGESQEQVYCRWFESQPNWVKLDLGWTQDNLGMAILINNVRPDPDQEYTIRHTLYVSHSKDVGRSWKILPGESMNGLPDGELFVYSDEPVKYTVYGLPG